MFIFWCVFRDSGSDRQSTESPQNCLSFLSCYFAPIFNFFPPFPHPPPRGSVYSLIYPSCIPFAQMSISVYTWEPFFLTWRTPSRHFLNCIFWTGLSLLYSMFWKPLRVKLECSPHCPYRRALLHVWGRTPFIDSSPTDGHLGSPQKFAMTDNAVMDSLGHRYVHLVGSAPSEHPSRRGTVESKAHVCVVLPDFAQFPISTPQQCLRVHVSHKLTNRTYC